ncbi:2'-5' RNA ligase family protein, partial [Streptomyces scabiei]
HRTHPRPQPLRHHMIKPDDPGKRRGPAIREAIGDVLGDVPEKAEGFTPHVSVAYSAGDAPAQPIAQILDDLNLTPAQARISSAGLIVIHRDNQMYEWEPFAKVSLG